MNTINGMKVTWINILLDGFLQYPRTSGRWGSVDSSFIDSSLFSWFSVICRLLWLMVVNAWRSTNSINILNLKLTVESHSYFSLEESILKITLGHTTVLRSVCPIENVFKLLKFVSTTWWIRNLNLGDTEGNRRTVSLPDYIKQKSMISFLFCGSIGQ